MTNKYTVQIDIKLSLPDTVAHEAEASRLLTAEALEALVKTEITRRRTAQLFAAADRLAALPGSALTEAEIEAEIEAARAERRNEHAIRR